MSPILVRPVREQLEHDRVIRLLQAKYKRKFEVAVNPGNEQTMPVGTGPSAWYPDLVLQSADRHRKLAGVIEVETAESVNHLEAMSQWAAFTRFRVPFHLYVPIGSVDTARRFCSDLNIPAAEIWAYQAVGEQLRFSLVHRSAEPSRPRVKTAPAVERARAAGAGRQGSGNGSRAVTRRVASRPATARPAAAPAAVRPRGNGQTASRPGRAASTANRRPVVKAKATARRAPSKAAKPKTTGAARAAKRR